MFDPSSRDHHATGLPPALDQLQQEVLAEARKTFSPTVIHHWMHPRNPGVLADADGEAWVQGSCGDTLGLFLKVEGDSVRNASFVTDGCGSSIAAGSVTVALILGEPLRVVRELTATRILEALGGLPPNHAHCAELAARTLRAALDDHEQRRRRRWPTDTTATTSHKERP